MAYNDDDCGDEFVGYNEWAVESLGVELFTDFVYDYDDGERGVFVAEDIAPQTRVLSVPFSSLLTLEWLREQAAKGHNVYSKVSFFHSLVEMPRNAWDPDREDDLLALTLLYERFGARDQSPWRPHLELLPKSYDNLLYFTVEETQALQGSTVFIMAQQMRRKVQEDYDRLRASTFPELMDAVLACHPDLTQEMVEAGFSIEQFTWALSTIWSRFVSLRLNEAGVESSVFPVLKAMAPVFDMLNHDPYAEVSHGYNAKTNALEIVTHQHVAAGTQLCINYGAVSNHKLLTLYGFVVPGNPYNAMDLWLPMDKITTKLYDAKVQALLALGIDHELTAVELTANEDVDPTMLLTARITALECDDEAELAAAVEKIKFGGIVSVANENRALEMLLSTLETMLAQYEHNEDRSIDDLKDNDDDDKHQSHMDMIAVILIGDRLILENTVKVLQNMKMTILSSEEESEIRR